MPQYDRTSDAAYKTLAKNDINSNDIVKVTNLATGSSKKITVETLLPSLATAGSTSESLYASITNKNQLNFKGIKSADTGLLTIATVSNNIELTVLEAGIDLSLCNNATSGFLTGVDFTETVTGECGPTNGGTGLSTVAKGSILYANQDDSIAAAASSTNGQILVHNTTTGIPAWSTLDAGTNLTLDVSVAGVLKLDAAIAAMSADLDMADNDIDLGTGYLSADGASAGIRVTGNNTYFGIASAYFNDDQLNLGNGGIRFGNTFAASIKPNTTASSTAGKALTIESGASAAAAAGNLNLTGGTASGNGAGGSVIVTAGRDTSGSADGTVQLKTYTGGTATAGLTVGAEGQDVTVNTGNLIITSAAKGIVHTGSGTITQSTDHSTGVELNTTSGVITLANVALAAAAEADFKVDNDTVQAESVILLTVQSNAAGSATNNASLHAELDEVEDNYFNVRLTNPGAGNTTGIHKIHFLVINPAIS